MDITIEKSNVQKIIAFIGNTDINIEQWGAALKTSLILTIPIGIYLSQVFGLPVILFSLFVFFALFVDMIMGIALNVYTYGEPFDKRRAMKTGIDFLIIIATIVLFSMLTAALNSFNYSEGVAKVIDGGASALFIALMTIIGLSILAGIADKGKQMNIMGFDLLAKVLGVRLKKIEKDLDSEN